MSIAILEAVVHALDVWAAIGAGTVAIPSSAMGHAVEVLASMADPVSFIDAATGRAATPELPVLH